MKAYTSYIIGGIMLLIGLGIGWAIKPAATSSMDSTHHHGDASSASSDEGGEIWTCSMHPQIRQDEAGICPICEMDLIPLDNSMSNDDPTILRMNEEAVKLSQIETFVVGDSRGDSSNSGQSSKAEIKVDGSVVLDERTVKSQTAHLSGRIEEMLVTFEGQYITKGQRIGRLYSVDLLAASQELLTAHRYDDRVEGLEEAAVQKLKNWKISDDAIQQMLEGGRAIETIDIYADHSGYVLDKKLSQGDYVKQGQVLYSTGSTGRLWLVFDVFESDIGRVRVGSKVSFTTPSVPNRAFDAGVTYVDPLLNPDSRTAIVRAEIDNHEGLLKPGMLLDGMIEASSGAIDARGGEEAVSIPNSAILWTGDKSVVYVQVPDNEVPSFEFREVEIERREGDFSVLKSGIAVGDEVVVQGAFVIDAAAQLNNNLSMMNRDVKVKKDEDAGVVPSFAGATPDVFKEQLDGVVVAYLGLKNALVNTSADEASLEADLFLKSLAAMDMDLLAAEPHMYWMENLRTMEDHGKKIKDRLDVEEQRDQFDFLSQAVIKSVRAFGTAGTTYYVQHCPMAKGNQGADWISAEEGIRNPYFGDKMMKCGVVKLELK